MSYNELMELRIKIIIFIIFLVALSPTNLITAAQLSENDLCKPTEEDEMGPFYRPGAPLRSHVGVGYLLTGTVRSSETCAGIGSPLIEFWQAGPDGRYVDAYRAAIITDKSGIYRFETSAPPPYVSRPPHIHIRVSAPGFVTLTTQHYLKQGQTEAVFDLVLMPDPLH